jgi:hypothetical protein
VKLCRVTYRQACEFVHEHHRHHKPPQGHIVSIGCKKYGVLIGVAMLGRPVSRRLDDGKTMELTRLCIIEGNANAASWLATRAKRLCHAMGCDMISCTLPSEGGGSMRAAGFLFEGEAGGGNWSKTSRTRDTDAPQETKHRWRAPTPTNKEARDE